MIPSSANKEDNAGRFLGKIQEFLQAPNGVNSFVLEGPLGDQVIPMFSDYVSMFDGFFIMVNSSESKQNAIQWHKRVLELTIPQRVRDLHIVGDAVLAKTFKQAMSLKGLPYAVLAFGEEVNMHKKMVMLGCVAGIEPTATLKEFQQWSSQRLAAFQ